MSYDNQVFAKSGRPWPELADELARRRRGSDDINWDSLKNMKASYNAGEDVVNVAWDAYAMFKGDNMLYGATLHRSLPALANDVVNMMLSLLNARKGAGGTVTTGGTESILLGVRAAFRNACQKRSFTGAPVIIAPYSVHPAFDKAASLMGITVKRVPLAGFRGDPDAMANAITDNTFMVVGSAPAYPLGHVDDITAFACIAKEHDLWLHVDACVGGFFLPFAAALDYPVPAFDFSIPEVRSISVDLHKYGYTARGASMILLSDQQLARFHQFNFDSWPTGTFNTPTLAGSRPAGAVASAWAVMNYLGHSGYMERVQKTLESKRKIIEAAEGVPGIRRCGDPQAGIVGFTSDDEDLDMLALRDGMTARGWQTAAILEPKGFQVLLNYRHNEVASAFGTDLLETARLVRKGDITSSGGDLSYGG